MIKKTLFLLVTGLIAFGSYGNLAFSKENATTQVKESFPDGWFKAGSEPKDYEVGSENVDSNHGKSGYIKCKNPKTKEFGTLMQQIKMPSKYIGKRLKLSAKIKSEEVTNWAGLWMRIDGQDKKITGFDNMSNRPIKGTTDWQTYSIVLDVQEGSKNLSFGVLNMGNGKVWIDDVNFEIVDNSIATTNIPI